MKSITIALLLTVSVCVGQAKRVDGYIPEIYMRVDTLGNVYYRDNHSETFISVYQDSISKHTNPIFQSWHYDSSYIQIFSKKSGKKILGIDSSLRNYYFTKEFDGRIVVDGKQIYPPTYDPETLRNVQIQPQTFEDLYNARLEDFATIFVILWDEYAKECWVDSTIGVVIQYRKMFKSEIEDSIRYGSPIWESHNGDNRNRFNLVIPMKSKRWIHPTKPNPEGFVEFLRRKTK